ncbi:tail assembly chaperone [Weissella paramesenteroides]
MQATIKGQTNELKFNYRALFKANAEFSEIDDKGNRLKDGALNLFNRVLTNDITVIPDLIKVAGGFGKLSDDDLFDAVEELTNGGDDIEQVMSDLKDEMKNSGFFNQAISAQVKQSEEFMPQMEAMAENDQQMKMQLPAIKRMTALVKENL